MTREQAFRILQDVFNDVFLDEYEINDRTSADDIEEWDSIAHISLIVAVEETFNLKFNMGEVEKTRNVGEFIDLILSKNHDKS